MNEDDYYVEIGETSGKIVLPSEISKEKSKKKVENAKVLKKVKWTFIAMFALIVYFYYANIVHFFLDILKQNPTVFDYYLFVETNISNNTLKGLFFMSFLGSLFFLVLPSEALFIYFLSTTSHFPLFILTITVFGSLLGLGFNYFFGRFIGKNLLKKIFSEEKFYNYKEKINKFGGYVLLIGNILPGPIEVLAVFYGGFKFEFKRFIYLAFIGRLIKYVLLFLAFFFFWEEITFYYNGFLEGIEMLKNKIFLK